VIASTAAVGNAIHRNRAKRRLRELFRAHQDRLPAHCDFLLIARAAAYDRPFAELEKNFLHACGLLKPGAEPAPHA
jgi:ribonuclease P protein component